MGSISGLMKKMFEKKSFQIVVIGLDGSGKTTIVYKMKSGESRYTMPTIGFNVEEITYKNTRMVLWDLGGQEKLRTLWGNYYKKMDGVIFVVDSSEDKERMEENKQELHRLKQDCAHLLLQPFLLVLANKQDLVEAKGVYQVAEELNLLKESPMHTWNIIPCSAITNEGLDQAFNWLSSVLQCL